MGASNLDDVFERIGPFSQSRMEFFQRWNQAVADFFSGRNMHRGGKCIVGRLAAVAVIIGMHRRFRAQLAAQDFNGAVGNHLIGIHIGLGARTGLPHGQGEVIIELSFGHLFGRADDRTADFGLHVIERQIGPRSGKLDNPQSTHDWCGHGFFPDWKID